MSVPAGSREFAAKVPGGLITASRSGSGAPVLILHGGPGLSDYTAPLAGELDDAFGVIRSSSAAWRRPRRRGRSTSASTWRTRSRSSTRRAPAGPT
jgi:pimeloyl-ACP methyl ester carboxylesterase